MIEVGLQFTSKRVLKFSIVLLGASLSIGTILNVGLFIFDGDVFYSSHMFWWGTFCW